MSKLNIKKEQLQNFSIDLVKDFEGCPSALKFLKARFGDRVDNLQNCKKEILELIEKDEKSDWVINFLLNLIQKKQRLMFYETHLIWSLDEYDDHSFKYAMLDLFSVVHKKGCVQAQLDSLKQDESNYEYRRLILESLFFLYEDKDKKYTRSITDALMKLAEANVNLDIVKYNYESNIQATAKSLMEYVNLWKM
jgi:hypothetical protein